MQVGIACPLCRCRRDSFFCASCVRGGDFSPVRGSHRPLSLTRFADVQLRHLSVQAEAEDLGADCSLLLDRERDEVGKFRAELVVVERRAVVLGECVKAKREAVRRAQASGVRVGKEVEALRAKLKAARGEKVLWRQTLDRIGERKGRSAAGLKSVRSVLLELRAEKVRELMRLVFPISDKREDPQCNSAVESQIFEALNLTYYHGSWVDLGTASEAPDMQIVGPCLPANLDSAAFLALLSAGDNDKCIAASCGLALANQAVQVIAHITAQHLPCPMSLSDFLSPNESVSAKCSALARLKRNIAVLCVRLGVPAKLVCVNEVLGNLRLFEAVMNEADDVESREKLGRELASRLEIASPVEEGAAVPRFTEWSEFEQLSVSATARRQS